MAWILLWRAAASTAVQAPPPPPSPSPSPCQGLVRRAPTCAAQDPRPDASLEPGVSVLDCPCPSKGKGGEAQESEAEPEPEAAEEEAVAQLGGGSIAGRSGPAAELAPAHIPSRRLMQLRSARELRFYDSITQNVPHTGAEAFRLFFSRPAILTCTAVACLALSLRLLLYPTAYADVPVALAVALWWVLQEWLIHAKLLHSACAWWGKDIHIAHHNMPYHHISIDGFKVVGPTMVLAFLVFRTIFQEDRLFLTALATYYFMGLAYEWTHFLVHTKVPMRTYLARVIKRAHVKHHLRDDHFWFSFTCPPLDNLMGTTPSRWVVG